MYAFKIIEDGIAFFGFDDSFNKNCCASFFLSDENYREIIEGQALGKVIIFNQETAEPSLIEPAKAKTKLELLKSGKISMVEYNVYISKLREKAYKEEADALFFQSERGEIKRQDWLDKISEIKTRYPKAEKSASCTR